MVLKEIKNESLKDIFMMIARTPVHVLDSFGFSMSPDGLEFEFAVATGSSVFKEEYNCTKVSAVSLTVELEPSGENFMQRISCCRFLITDRDPAGGVFSADRAVDRTFLEQSSTVSEMQQEAERNDESVIFRFSENDSWICYRPREKSLEVCLHGSFAQDLVSYLRRTENYFFGSQLSWREIEMISGVRRARSMKEQV